MNAKDEFGLFQGYTASFKDFMGGGATTDLLQFLGEGAPAGSAFQTDAMQTQAENLQLKQQINQLQAQVFDLQTRNSQLQQRLNQAEFQLQGATDAQQQIQHLFEQNTRLQEENDAMRARPQGALQGQASVLRASSAPPPEIAPPFAPLPDEAVIALVAGVLRFCAGGRTPQRQTPADALQIDSKTLPAAAQNALACFDELVHQTGANANYFVQKLQKAHEAVQFYQTQAARVTQICRENIIAIRKQTEAATGWRINLLDDMRVRVERAGNRALWLQLDRGRVVYTSLPVEAAPESVCRTLARQILRE